ncbi:MAG: substrate-binding domain-containing protein [Lachnospiraceae bacterium]|nr:substrate-binding domain-containing protein [Lachnospiraceae bacterium]MBR3361120.1 substrate-binding domain-containing protein [Lachnospiraceae bacterium]
MKIKKILAIALAAAMVFALAACGKSGGDTPAPAGSGSSAAPAADSAFTWNGQKEVWAILPTTGVPGLMMHADSMGWVMEQEGWKYVPKDAEGNPANQVTFVEDAIAAGNVGALMIAAMDTPMLEDVCEQARKAGIAVDFLGAAPDYEIAGYIATKYSITGMFAVEAAEDWAEKRVAEGGNIPKNANGKYEVAVDYYLDITDGIYRSNAIVGTLAESDVLECVSTTQAYGNSAQQDAYNNAQAVLAAHPDCRIFIAYEPDEAIGAASAIADFAAQKGLDLADFAVFPCYSEDPTFQAMYAEVAADHSANAIKGYSSYGATATEEEQQKYDPSGAHAYSPTGEKLAKILLGVCGEGSYKWNYGEAYFDDISATNVYGLEKLWQQGEANPCEKYEVPNFLY